MNTPASFIHIGPATLSDIESIDRIEQGSFATPWSKDLLRAAILNRQYEVHVLREDGMEVLGFYIAHSIDNRSNLDNLAVEAEVRGRGFGWKLVSDWINRSRQGQHITLSLQVNTANKPAQRLYEKFEFKTMRLLVAYYPNGDDAYQMERSIEPIGEGVPVVPPHNGRTWYARRRQRSGARS
jgi:ribosomal-protein-alanine N-acetyltransferase